jgi:hypothetical protein
MIVSLCVHRHDEVAAGEVAVRDASVVQQRDRAADRVRQRRQHSAVVRLALQCTSVTMNATLPTRGGGTVHLEKSLESWTGHVSERGGVTKGSVCCAPRSRHPQLQLGPVDKQQRGALHPSQAGT